ncbi:hypothetical protein PMKS-001848 [Pichia membranifaciens]|uniref:ASTRA-associated protein 1 n=1 Tax=Pichia membranifaciens TaxID=4926 RepID=A0A1Q2YFP5_9ASCO|nr:hypothetical protein PMKS-001848 [Pichia membranifaciens]
MTADESGLVIWWNLTTRRPLGVWKAHSGSILTIEQLGIDWESNGSHDFSIPKITESYGQLLTHSKDGSIKIWNMINLIDGSSIKAGFTYSCLLKKKISSACAEIPIPTPPLVYELPVNAMNFTNVEMNLNGLLITPATTDSEGWDLYKINLKETGEHRKLKRLIQNYHSKLRSTEKVEEISDDDSGTMDFTKRGKLGVIMKVSWIGLSRFLVGYESGIVIGYEIYQDVGDSATKTKAFLQNNDLEGNPITAICIDKVNGKILCSSAGSKVSIMDLNSADRLSDIFETKHKGINSIDCDSFSKSVGLVTWDGYARFYNYDESSVLKFSSKMRRQLPAISNSKEVVDDQNNEVTLVNSLQTQRASVIRFTKKQLDPREVKFAGINILYNNGRSKNIVKRNKEEVFGERWLFVGYQDGKVAMYSIK